MLGSDLPSVISGKESSDRLFFAPQWQLELHEDPEFLYRVGAGLFINGLCSLNLSKKKNLKNILKFLLANRIYFILQTWEFHRKW